MSNDAATTTARPWLDASLPVDERVELLLQEMTLVEKVGLFFQTMIAMGPDGALSEADPTFGLPSTDEYINARHMTHFNLLGAAPTAGAIARWHNRLQELAASTRLGCRAPHSRRTDAEGPRRRRRPVRG